MGISCFCCRPEAGRCLACRAILIVITQRPPCSHTRSCGQSSSMQLPAIYRVSHSSRSDLAGEALHQPAHGVGRQPARRHHIVRRRVHEQLPAAVVWRGPGSDRRNAGGAARRGAADQIHASEPCIRVALSSRGCQCRAPPSQLQRRPRPARLSLAAGSPECTTAI